MLHRISALRPSQTTTHAPSSIFILSSTVSLIAMPCTWSAPMILTSNEHSWDLGYPSTVELKDGSLLTVWYEKTAASPHAVLRQARLVREQRAGRFVNYEVDPEGLGHIADWLAT